MTIIIFLALGAMSGFLAGLLGVGGSMVMVPFLVYLFDQIDYLESASIKFAIASAMTVVCFTAISSMRAHYKKGGINWRVVAIFTLGIIPGGLLASLGVFANLDALWFYYIFGAFAYFTAGQMWFGWGQGKKSDKRKLDKKKIYHGLPKKGWLASYGGITGFISGLVGAGGGFMIVPFQTYFGVPVNWAIANSAATGFPIALANTIGYLWADNGGVEQAGVIGFVYWPAVVTIAIMSVLTAPIGAHFAHTLPRQTLRRIFSVVTLMIGTYIIWRSTI